jgi:hypothetical protein
MYFDPGVYLSYAEQLLQQKARVCLAAGQYRREVAGRLMG